MLKNIQHLVKKILLIVILSVLLIKNMFCNYLIVCYKVIQNYVEQLIIIL